MEVMIIVVGGTNLSTCSGGEGGEAVQAAVVLAQCT